MKVIRKLTSNEQSNNQSNRMLILKKKTVSPLIYNLNFDNNRIIKFCLDHWMDERSFLTEYESERSKYLEYLCYFKKIVQVTKTENCVIFYLAKENNQTKHLQMQNGHKYRQHFANRYKSKPQTIEISQLLQQLQQIQLKVQEKFFKQKKKSIPEEKLAEPLIKSLFLKSLKNFKNSPFIVMGFSLDFNTNIEPYMNSLAISYSLLDMLQINLQDLIIESLRKQTLPDIFTNYGFKDWSIQHLKMIRNLFRSLLNDQQSEGPSNFSFESIRELIDKYENKKKVLIKSAFEIPLFASLQIIKVIGTDSYNIIQKTGSSNKEQIKDLTMKNELKKSDD